MDFLILFTIYYFICYNNSKLFLFLGFIPTKNNSKKKIQDYYGVGYLYNEYKKEAYFWELIKIAEKELIILSLLYYQDSGVAKGVLVLFITYLYQQLNGIYKPYILKKLNRLDYYSNTFI
ncbi:unnamed protein product [Paramecium sonneborni]|uniref:Uncharacterized protein n=1 Tax=Paramecium sonneborni TaxID=65129 RepID=A0A8S1QMD1_9CILI|nr:unnamed protein product [Paramecium sonneborni]